VEAWTDLVGEIDPHTLDPGVASDAEAVLAAVSEAEPLTDEQRAILDFERRWFRQAGAKEQAIRDSFQVSPTRYYQQLNALIDLPEALTYDPQLVNRLLRLRASAARTRRRLG
jgi:hypothetical protein